MPNRLLTEQEIDDFRDRHFFTIWDFLIPDEGKYVEDTVLGGYVLVFKKQDGNIIYVLTDYDPSINDPSTIVYITRETLRAIGENTENVFSNVGSGFKIATPVLVLIVIIIFREPLLALVKSVTGK